MCLRTCPCSVVESNFFYLAFILQSTMIAVIWNGRQATTLLSISPRDLEACSRIVWFLEDWYKTIVQLGGMKMKR